MQPRDKFWRMSRRRFLMLTASGTTAVAIGGIQSSAVLADQKLATITGVVFAGGSDEGHHTLSGVLVSDGITVVKTDEQGRYTLTMDPSRRLTSLVFISMPSGYTVPVDHAQTPQFYAALPNLAAGETRKQDFVLSPAPAQRGERGQFIHLTDVHVSGDYGTGIDYERERFRAQIEQLNRLSGTSDFILLSGDLSNLGRDSEYQAYQDGASSSSRTIWSSVGNHEWGGNGEDPANYKQDVEHYRHYQGPEWYSFEYRGYHVVVLEDYDAGEFSPTGQPPATRDHDQFTWLQADLAAVGPKRPLIVVAHVAMNDPLTIPGTTHYIELLRKYNVKLVLSGHTHRNDVDLSVFPGAPNVITEPGWSPQDGGPVGFRRVLFGPEGKLSFPFKAFDVPRKLAILHPAPGHLVPADGPIQVQVNAYNTTSEVTSAEYRIDGGEWSRLGPDGVWTWVATRQIRLSAGDHHIEARVRDDLDQEWAVQGTFTAAAHQAGPRVGSEWSTFHGNNAHAGSAADMVAPPLRLAWIYRSRGAILASSPAISQGLAFIGVKDENGVQQNGVVALDAVQGREVWRARLDAAVDGTPSVSGGVVYASSIRGTVHAFDIRTGKPRWERRYGVDPDGVQRWWAYACPVVANGLVYQSMGFVLLALDAQTGAEKWRFYGGGANSYYGMPALSEDGRIVYFCSKGDAVWALAAASGKELWHKPPVDGLYRSTVAVAGGIVYARTGDMVLALNGATGAEVKRYTGLGYTYNQESPAVAGGAVVSPGGNGTVHSFDIATGQRQWMYRTGATVASSPAVSGDTVYVGSHDGFLYALDRRNGGVRWRFEIGPWVKSSPAVSGNMVVVGAYDGNVYGFVQAQTQGQGDGQAQGQSQALG